MDYADEVMKMFKRAQFFSPISKEYRTIAKAMAPHMPGVASSDIASMRGYMGDVFKSNAHLRGVLAGEKGATQRQQIAGDYGVQLQNMRNLSDQIVQSYRNKGMFGLEERRGENEENMMRLGDKLGFNRSSSFGPAYPGSGRYSVDDITSEILREAMQPPPVQDVEDPVAKEKEKNKFDPFAEFGSIGTGM